MRTAITVGIKKDGTAEIIHHPNVGLGEQRRSFHAGDNSDGYTEIQLWESGKGMRRRKATKDVGGVDFNSAHPVHQQQDKTAAKTLPDLTPTTGGEGHVNFDAARPVASQSAGASESEPDSTDELDDLTIAALASLGHKEGVDLTGAKVKADYLQRIRDFLKLNESTVPELEQIAALEQAEVTADMLKADLINAIIANRL